MKIHIPINRHHESITTFAIADDHPLVRSAIRTFIQALGPNYKVVVEVSDGLELLKKVKNSNPDIIILDIEMPNFNGFQVLKELKLYNSNHKVIVLSAHYNEFFFKELILLGAASYLPKSCSEGQFITAVKTVLRDGFYITKEVSKEVVDELIGQNKIANLLTENKLSSREIEVIQLLAEGLLYKEIGDVLNISQNTVKYHIRKIYQRTDLKRIADLIKYAIRTGIAPINEPADIKFDSPRLRNMNK
jgi:DNA-binding NarL/FixJ family response regulator